MYAATHPAAHARASSRGRPRPRPRLLARASMRETASPRSDTSWSTTRTAHATHGGPPRRLLRRCAIQSRNCCGSANSSPRAPRPLISPSSPAAIESAGAGSGRRATLPNAWPGAPRSVPGTRLSPSRPPGGRDANVVESRARQRCANSVTVAGFGTRWRLRTRPRECARAVTLPASGRARGRQPVRPAICLERSPGG